MKVSIRLAQVADIPQMYVISSRAHLAVVYDKLIPLHERDAFNSRYQLSARGEAAFAQRMMRWLDAPEVLVAVATIAGRAVGYTTAERQDDALQLSGLFVDPDMQSMGVGSQLFTKSLSWRRSGEIVRLTVLTENTRARQLYERYGFHVSGISDRRFYSAPQVIMTQEL